METEFGETRPGSAIRYDDHSLAGLLVPEGNLTKIFFGACIGLLALMFSASPQHRHDALQWALAAYLAGLSLLVATSFFAFQARSAFFEIRALELSKSEMCKDGTSGADADEGLALMRRAQDRIHVTITLSLLSALGFSAALAMGIIALAG